MAARPIPTKNTHIMPSRLHLSASQPAGSANIAEREQKARRGIGQKFGIAHTPFAGQRERGDAGEDQHEQMVEEMPDVQQQEVEPVAGHGANRFVVGGKLTPWRR